MSSYLPVIEKWLTPDDCVVIEGEVRDTMSRFATEAEICSKIESAMSSVACDIARSEGVLGDWILEGLKELDTDAMFHYLRRPPGETILDVRVLVLSAITEAEELCREEGGAIPDFSIMRAWINVSLYTVYRFQAFVVEAAADAARDSALEMLSRGCREDSSVPRAVESASKKWLAAWEKGVRL